MMKRKLAFLTVIILLLGACTSTNTSIQTDDRTVVVYRSPT